MTVEEFNVSIWQYYLQLESDFYSTLNYVEFSEDNFNTFSKEYSKQLLSICSELDVIFKELCKVIDDTKEYRTITDYAEVLSNYDDLSNAKVKFLLYQTECAPFNGWTEESKPTWWGDYNSVKHNRLEEDNYKKGNLKNVFYALAALFILNRYLCKELSRHKQFLKEPSIKSKIFEMVGWPSCIPIGNGYVRVLQKNGNVSIVYDG